ncbi:acyltransferase [Paraburkholderia terrae]|uniref:Acyltransferase n=2 Tax=Paraburkholderia terrae TaxID=311230 RepID=A0ABM7TI81_9BURK|nr:acyltransferase [Paraburkholderia terrae]
MDAMVSSRSELKPREAGGRLAHIDAIRAIAALLVVVMHCAALEEFAASTSWLAQAANVLDFGRIGVVLFFGVSGFVIPASLISGEHPGTFWVRRFFRLYPAYWFSIALVLLTQWLFWTRSFSLHQILLNLTMLQNFLHAENLQGVYWTLKLELVFYVGCYLLFMVGLLERTALLAALSLLLTMIFVCYLDFYQGPLGFSRSIVRAIGLPSGSVAHAVSTGDNHPIPGLLNMNWGYFCAYFSMMFFGAVLRRWHDGDAGRVAQVLLSIVGVIWVVVLPMWGWYAFRASHVIDTVTVFAPCALALALFLVLINWIRVRSRVMAAIGLVSYSLYLLHPIVIDAIVWGGKRTGGTLDSSFVAFVLVCTLLSIGAAAACYLAIERSSIATGRSLARRLNSGLLPLGARR